MAKTSLDARGTRLGTKFRGKLAAAYGQRGVGSNSLWYVYSPRTKSDWVLRSDLEWDHFVLTESDSAVVNCNYLPEKFTLTHRGDTLEIPVDVIVSYRDGTTEWRQVRFAGNESDANSQSGLELRRRSDVVQQAGKSYRLWTEEIIRRNPLLLANWRRVIAWMAGARDRPLSIFRDELASALKTEGELTLAQIQSMCGEASFGLYAAAAFGELQSGNWASNLDVMPLSPHTIIRVQ